MAEASTRIRLCSTSDVDWDSAIRVEEGDLTLAVFNVNGVFYVTDDLCTHGPGSLSEGYLDGHTIECDFHNGAFDIRTGEVVTPPCMIPIKTYKVVIENENVTIEV
ncbi:non-heme iron oxygenase ferredoxin subunit [Sinorhizobium terangae]|uniref:non-heme iron oxygenase ferredoxin subunit n=1 Tax=Sinorhizobium terangae TaxID=110322 RepID=UPI001CD52296|nr:non-heme iron oxygenase ferredoxin subunit [Sinorhizobium terangae]MCA1407612.1 non-heme iron oxygenase ferredoxin subunit [Ensifer sp. BRP08]MCA1449547.1 non-heme iron oxygenase ferredoxin subunit [Ensifer sp. IC3342]WFU51420.1 non-heme iron oxygenase ferredoxin subunit [Sinorhizobium terangae]